MEWLQKPPLSIYTLVNCRSTEGLQIGTSVLTVMGYVLMDVRFTMKVSLVISFYLNNFSLFQHDFTELKL